MIPTSPEEVGHVGDVLGDVRLLLLIVRAPELRRIEPWSGSDFDHLVRAA
jgi:hypothetical protein